MKVSAWLVYFGGSEGEFVLCLRPCFWWLLVASGNPWRSLAYRCLPVFSASILTGRLPLSVCLYVQISSS